MSVPRPAMLVADRHDPQPPGLRHDMRLALVLARVQHLVHHARAVEIFGQQFRFLDRNGADQHRLALVVLPSPSW
jgi:hypothetical protein